MILAWCFIGSAVYVGGLWIFRKLQAKRDRLDREWARRRYRREIDHPSTFGDAA